MKFTSAKTLSFSLCLAAFACVSAEAGISFNTTFDFSATPGFTATDTANWTRHLTHAFGVAAHGVFARV